MEQSSEQFTDRQKVIITKNTSQSPSFVAKHTSTHTGSSQISVHCDHSPAVHLDHVTFSYDHHEQRRLWALKKPHKQPILNDVNMTVAKSIVYSLLGPSGCGKTTLLRCIIGRLIPDKGFVNVFGKEPDSSGSQIPGPGVGYMPQELALISQFTMTETLHYYGTLYQMSASALRHRIPFIINLLDLTGLEDKFVDNLSGGQKRRVSLAIALIHNPPLLILDEPTVGVDPLLRETIWKYLKTIANEGLTVIITTHYIEEARATNVVAFLRHGHILAEDDPQKLMDQFNVPTLELVFLLMARIDSNKDDNDDEFRNKRRSSIKHLSLNSGDDYSDTRGAEMTIPMMAVVKNEDISSPITKITNQKSDDRQSHASSTNRVNTLPKTLSIPKPLKIRFKESVIRIGALCRKNRIRLLRRPPELIINVIMPALQVALFCLCIGRDPKNIIVAVCNNEPSTVEPNLSRWFLESVNSEVINLKYYNSDSAAIDSVREGDSWAAIIINSNYSDALQLLYYGDGEPEKEIEKNILDESVIRIYLDASNALYANTVRRQIFDAVQVFAKKAADAVNQDLSRFKLPIKFEDPIYGSEKTDMVEFMGPGLIVLLCFFGTTAVTSIAFLSERREGSLERTLVAGVTSAEFILAQMLIVIFLLAFQIVITGIMSFWIFSLPQHGSYFWAITLMFLQGMCGMAYGLMISALCAQEIYAVLFGFGSMLPATNITGMFWPVGTMPPFLRFLSYLMPHTFAMESFRNIVIRGFGPSRPVVMIGFLVTGAWISIFLLVAIIVFKNNK